MKDKGVEAGAGVVALLVIFIVMMVAALLVSGGQVLNETQPVEGSVTAPK